MMPFMTFRRELLKVVKFSTMLVILMASSVEASRRPNVVLILADDLGWNDTSLNDGSKFHRTPHLTRLAARGMAFSRAYAASPLCSPTRASILTGQNPTRTGITAANCHLPVARLKPTRRPADPTEKLMESESATRLDTRYVTLAESLAAAGYATGHFGKWHLGRTPYSPLQHGFDVDFPRWAGPGPGRSYFAPWRYNRVKANEPGEHIEDRLAKEAIQWMEKQTRAGQPFFLNYWQFSVHAPFEAKKERIKKYLAVADPKQPQHSPTYAAMVETLDENLGRILDAVDRLGIGDNTVFVFLSDNGGNIHRKIDNTVPTSNAPLRGGKGTIYEGGVRVPCVVLWPGLTKPGSRSSEIIQSTDFYPTLLDGLKIPRPAGTQFDGMSIMPALKGMPLKRKGIFTYFPHIAGVPDQLPPAIAVTTGKWKLIRLFHQGNLNAHQYRLYNLKSDPGETTDLSALEPGRVKALDMMIERHLTETRALVPIPNPSYTPDGAESQ
jgi:arylsulfatase A-like enzyme